MAAMAVSKSQESDAAALRAMRMSIDGPGSDDEGDPGQDVSAPAERRAAQQQIQTSGRWAHQDFAGPGNGPPAAVSLRIEKNVLTEIARRKENMSSISGGVTPALRLVLQHIKPETVQEIGRPSENTFLCRATSRIRTPQQPQGVDVQFLMMYTSDGQIQDMRILQDGEDALKETVESMRRSATRGGLAARMQAQRPVVQEKAAFSIGDSSMKNLVSRTAEFMGESRAGKIERLRKLVANLDVASVQRRRDLSDTQAISTAWTHSGNGVQVLLAFTHSTQGDVTDLRTCSNEAQVDGVVEQMASTARRSQINTNNARRRPNDPVAAQMAEVPGINTPVNEPPAGAGGADLLPDEMIKKEPEGWTGYNPANFDVLLTDAKGMPRSLHEMGVSSRTTVTTKQIRDPEVLLQLTEQARVILRKYEQGELASTYDLLKIGPSAVDKAGMSVFATRDLPQNTLVGFYGGHGMPESTWNIRTRDVNPQNTKTYLMGTKKTGYVVDGREVRTPWAFVNQPADANDLDAPDEPSEDCNLMMVNFGPKLIAMVTTRPIRAGEEFLCYYGMNYGGYEGNRENPIDVDYERSSKRRKGQVASTADN